MSQYDKDIRSYYERIDQCDSFRELLNVCREAFTYMWRYMTVA